MKALVPPVRHPLRRLPCSAAPGRSHDDRTRVPASPAPDAASDDEVASVAAS